MISTKSIRVGIALIGFAIEASAQVQRMLDPTFLEHGRAEHVTYDYADKRIVRQSTLASSPSIGSFCYVNTDTSGLSIVATAGTEFIDWGILGGTASTQCAGLSDIVSNFTFAYTTTTLDQFVNGPGAALTVTFYRDFAGFGQDSGNAPVATFAFTGMPGSIAGEEATYVIEVDLAGSDAEFLLPDGRFGYGYRGDGQTGPVLCFCGESETSPEPATGNVDAFDIWAPDTQGVHTGTFFFGGPPSNFSSWYGRIARADLSATPAVIVHRNEAPNAPGSLTCSSAELGQLSTLSATDPDGHAMAFAFAFDTPVSIPLAGGQRLLCADLGGNGELLTGGGLGLPQVGPAMWSLDWQLPADLDMIGFAYSVQVLFAFGTVPFSLSSACDLTLGG